jgi:hypothetical protein
VTSVVEASSPALWFRRLLWCLSAIAFRRRPRRPLLSHFLTCRITPGRFPAYSIALQCFNKRPSRRFLSYLLRPCCLLVRHLVTLAQSLLARLRHSIPSTSRRR